MTKKKDETSEEPVLGTGAAGDPAKPDAVKPVGYERITELPDEARENTVQGKKHEKDEDDK